LRPSAAEAAHRGHQQPSQLLGRLVVSLGWCK
jgi:hypothetical protein